MIETSLGMNGYGCTSGDGNTAEEYEAIAVALLRLSDHPKPATDYHLKTGQRE